MQAIEPPNSFHLSAAAGWIELGNPAEAKAELSKVDHCLLFHPDVLELTWVIHAQEQRWQDALEAASALIQCDPQRVSGWVHHAYALRRVPHGGLRAAWDALLPASDAFPSEPIVPYNLSCYASQLGEFAKALEWFRVAVQRGDKQCLKRMALSDPDLQPIWTDIRQM